MDLTPTHVLVMGATGALGRPVVRRLRERGVAVRAACRHPDRASDLAALGAEVIGADLTDAASLGRACNGVQRVLCAAHGMLGRGRWVSERVDDAGHRALFAAARTARVERLVYTSAFGAAAADASAGAAAARGRTISRGTGGRAFRATASTASP